MSVIRFVRKRKEKWPTFKRSIHFLVSFTLSFSLSFFLPPFPSLSFSLSLSYFSFFLEQLLISDYLTVSHQTRSIVDPFPLSHRRKRVHAFYARTIARNRSGRCFLIFISCPFVVDRHQNHPIDVCMYIRNLRRTKGRARCIDSQKAFSF